jgi:hypothetical protein
MKVQFEGEITTAAAKKIAEGGREYLDLLGLFKRHKKDDGVWTPVVVTFEVPGKKIVFIPDPDGDYIYEEDGGMLHYPKAPDRGERYRREEQDV